MAKLNMIITFEIELFIANFHEKSICLDDQILYKNNCKIK